MVTASNGYIYAIGGSNGLSELSMVEEYNPQTNTWTTRTSMPTPRMGLAVAAGTNGKIYAIGGQRNSIILDIVEEYDPQTDTWTTRRPMPTPRYYLGATGSPNGKIYAMGGLTNDGSRGRTEEYDPLTDTWMPCESMPTGRYGFGMAATEDGRLYTIGGMSGDYEDVVEVYDSLAGPLSAHFVRSEVAGNADLPNSSETHESEIAGNLTIHGGGTVVKSTAGNLVKLDYGKVESVSAVSILIGSGQVLNSTLQGGGIGAGNGSLVQGNNIENSPGWGIQTGGTVTVQGNRLVGEGLGIQASSGMVQGNLIANSAGVGLEINGDVVVSDNTFTGNAGNTIVIKSGVPTIQGNNLEGNTGTYDIENLTTNGILAEGNWWGTTNDSAIDLRIYDFQEDYNLGQVGYSPEATGPIQTAPAYVRSVTLDPESPVGIEMVTFEVEFSRLMSTEWLPELSFQSILNNTWTVYNTSNSGLPSNVMRTISIDSDGTAWFGTEFGGIAYFDGNYWEVFNTSNSDLPDNGVYAIAIDLHGSHWFGTNNGGAAHFDGTTWSVYTTTNSGLPSNTVHSIVTDADGSQWFGTVQGGAAHFDGVTWTVYNTINSGLPDNVVLTITTDKDGTHWFGTHSGGVAAYNGVSWAVYNTTNSGLPSNEVRAIAEDADGSLWFGTYFGGAAHYDGVNWTVYNNSNSGLPSNNVYAIITAHDGSHWFGTRDGGVAHFDGITWTVYTSLSSGLPGNTVLTIAEGMDNKIWFGTELYGVGVYQILPARYAHDDPVWLDDTHFQTTYEITTLIPRGDYRITVAGAKDSDGMEIAPNTDTTFTVDYAGGVTDTSAPPAPNVTACAGLAVGDLSASWSASDPDSAITLYQYAIGTTPGGTEVINWTSTSATSFDLHGLSLTAGRLYYVSVKARNEGGLWSVAATAPGVAAGSGVCVVNLVDVYLPLLTKR